MPPRTPIMQPRPVTSTASKPVFKPVYRTWEAKKQISVRFTDEDHAYISAQAERLGLKRTELVRQATLFAMQYMEVS